MRQNEAIVRERFEVTGIVQGVGFRPFVYSVAHRLGLKGFVGNHSAGVTIEVEGDQDGLARFARLLRDEAPPLAQIDSVRVVSLPMTGSCDFQIVASESAPSLSTPIAPDTATCDACLAEMRNPSDRRYRYPFINCTNCGPRYTIVRDVPYDRPLTTMESFPMCDACLQEYADPANRRYHAQPNACPDCGPRIWLVGGPHKYARGSFDTIDGSVGESAIAEFHRRIAADEIVAIKGIGGFHLACSAYSEKVIHELRRRKGRVDKPLAIMVADIDAAKRIVSVSPDEERLLSCRARPIVLLRRHSACDLPDLIAPGNDVIGVMLPYSPLHALLIERQSLVMTSGNVSDEPIVRTNSEAFERLNSLADAFLLHDREIHVVCDDSVTRVLNGHERPVRRSRGYAPMPIRLNGSGPSVLASGGELKATFCLTKGEYAFMGPHIGDLGNLETLNAFRRGVEHFQRLFRIEPQIVACDMHPSYLSGYWAREHARTNGLKLVEVQHHHAHVASVLAEHGIDRDKRVIGISFDGTGYGPDGAIWGGEVLIASCIGYQRMAHLKYIGLPGGDASVKHPFRSALAHLWAAKVPWDERLPCVSLCPNSLRNVILGQLDRNLNCFQTSSMGRLFDAVSALIGIRQSVTYEAQAAIELEVLSDDQTTAAPYPFTISDTTPRLIDPTPLIRAIADDVIAHVPQGGIVCRFQSSIAKMVVDACVLARDNEMINEVVLSGGVFQNQRLLQQTIESLQQQGFFVFTNEIVPCNDGGLALGQAVIAATA